MLTIVAPIRRPVKEPGPDMKVIFSRSWKVAPWAARWFSRTLRSFSAISWPRSSVYVKVWPEESVSLVMAVKVEVSRYKFIFKSFDV